VTIQHPTVIAELDLFTGFEDTTALEDKKSLTIFSAMAVVGCTSKMLLIALLIAS